MLRGPRGVGTALTAVMPSAKSLPKCAIASEQPTYVPGGVYWYDSNGNGL